MKKINKRKLFLIFSVICETILIKNLFYKIFSNVYFYDSYKILSIMRGHKILDTSFTYTAGLFNIFNIFKFTTIQQWSWFLAMIFVPIILSIVCKTERYTISKMMFIIASFALLNIYVFVLSKDMIQFLYFFVIYFILNTKWSNKKKLIAMSVVFLYEALNFRMYYVIMLGTILITYISFNLFMKEKKSYMKFIMLSFFIFFLGIFFIKGIFPHQYNSMIEARFVSNNYRTFEANTEIKDLFKLNNNYFNFIINYVINFIRFSFPIELMFKGIKYSPFVLYQIFVTFHLIRSFVFINNKNCLWIFIIIAFLMTSTIFEPDFGSAVRHESALILFLLHLVEIDRKDCQNEKSISNNSNLQEV